VRIPRPIPGLVIRYSYLWRREFLIEREEGRKDRPSTVILAAIGNDGETRVYVLPISHRPPGPEAHALEIPLRVKRHLGLDGDQSWIVLDEINDFIWPGHDLRPVPGAPSRVDYGVLPPRFFDEVRTAFLDLARSRRVKRVPRD
jgi:hypothetical protein